MSAPRVGWHAASRVVAVPGGYCHLIDVGPRDAPAVVLIHGIAVSSWAWRMNLDALAARHRVIAVCQKGHGWSERGRGGYDIASLAAFVLGALDKVGVARATFVGNSLGGAVSLQVAETRPERVARLVLVNAAALETQRPWPLLRTQVKALDPLYARFVGPTLLRAGLVALAYKNLEIDSHYMAGFWTPLGHPGSLKVLTAVARRLPEGLHAVDRGLDGVTQPTLIVWGARDGVLPVAGGYDLAKRLPHARLVLFEKSGHCPHEEEPERFNRLLLDWLGSTPP
ncbi:MAG: alpha/beta fold hydrolase [Deltaproteobacteria bacterium]|nr:alpha/beta fold hydrolase [Deltaproteobacteria bacterium]